MNTANNPKASSRTLIYLPIVHTLADMGGLGETVLQKTLQKLGRKRYSRKSEAIDAMWGEIERVVGALPLAWDKVRLYQDGLPVCGRETDIVTDLAQAGSRNHQLLLRLMHKGAALMGTESADLLVQEYQLVRQSLAAEGPARLAGEPHSSKSVVGSAALLERRDQYIARRINETIGPGETGILFLGMLHSLAALLDKDIGVEFPLHRPLGGFGEVK
ncbi:MAG: hypothetical protein JW718_07700 [Desulfovibrionaceae bacterium]|nr:hypothetical protein [Desulfovibrionaceae bacterium]